MAAEKTRVVDLEQQLADDASGELLDAICDQLGAEQANVKRQIDAGLPPEEFEQAELIHQGLSLAQQVAKDFWKSEH